MRLVLLGPPGVGKGTQGRRLAAEKGWALISTGEILRESVARGTPLGREAGRRMAAGELVGDDVMIGLVRERTAGSEARDGFVLDGFPRTVPQADALDAILEQRAQRLDAAVLLDAPEAELVRRLSGRLECPVCNRAYNLSDVRPRDGRHCDDHPGSELRARVDDTEETVRKRLEVYRLQTAPLIDYYRGTGRLKEVEGVGSADQVYRSLKLALGCPEPPRPRRTTGREAKAPVKEPAKTPARTGSRAGSRAGGRSRPGR